MLALKTLAVSIALLATMGIALAMWSETLLVNVTVYTGEVDVKFSSWSCSDSGPDPQAPGFHNTEEKNVASCDIQVERLDEEGDPIKLLVTLNNTYPGYTVDVTLTIDNIGTIPVKLYQSSISGSGIISASLIIPEDTQIDPGSSADYILRITIPQEAEENSTYSLEITLVFAQWNEVD